MQWVSQGLDSQAVIIQGYLCKNIWVMLQTWCIIPRYLQNIIGSIFCTIDKEVAWFFYFFKDPYLCVREHEWRGEGKREGQAVSHWGRSLTEPPRGPRASPFLILFLLHFNLWERQNASHTKKTVVMYICMTFDLQTSATVLHCNCTKSSRLRVA